MATMAKAQQLLEAHNVSGAFEAFAKQTGSKEFTNNNDGPTYQLAQKLGMELLKVERFEDARRVCQIVLGWVRSKENLSLSDSLSKTSKMSKSQLMKMEVWAGLTGMQCLCKLSSDDSAESELISEAEDLIEVLRQASAKSLMEAAVVGSTGKKLRNLFMTRKSLEGRLFAFQVSEALKIEWEPEMDKFLASIVRDLRIKKLFPVEILSSIEPYFEELTTRSPKLIFDFGLWLNDSKRTKENAAKYLCAGCRSSKECLFAGRLAAQIESLAETALETIVSGLLQDETDGEGRDSLVAEELLQLHVKLTTDNVDDNLPLLCQRSDDEANQEFFLSLAEKEFELVAKMRRVEGYLAKLRGKQPDSNLSPIYQAKALRLLQKREEALRVVDDSFRRSGSANAEMILLQAVLYAELESVARSRETFRKFLLLDTVALPVLQEASIFAWLMGFYDEAVELAKRMEGTNNSVLLHHQRFISKRGSDASSVVEQYGNDVDTAIKALLKEIAQHNASKAIMSEFEQVFRILQSLKVLGDLYRERGLCRLAKYYYTKALQLAKSRKLIGEQNRLGECLNWLETLRTPKFKSVAGEGGLGIVEDDESDESSEVDSKVSIMEADVFEQYYQSLYEGLNRLRKETEKKKNSTQNSLEEIVEKVAGEEDEYKTALWYERALFALLVEDNAEKCIQELDERETNATDTLRAQAILQLINSATLSEKKRQKLRAMIRNCAEVCGSDLILLRELYAQLLVHGEAKEEEKPFLISALVGLPLRAERAQMLLQKRGEDDELAGENADLYQWHRLHRIRDAARVQRSQISARLNEEWVVVTIAYDASLRRLFLCRTEQGQDLCVELDFNLQKDPKDLQLLQRFSELMQKNLDSTNGSTVEFASKVGKSDKNKWWDSRYELEQELTEWLVRFERDILGWRSVLLRGLLPPQQQTAPDRTRSSVQPNTTRQSKRNVEEETILPQSSVKPSRSIGTATKPKGKSLLKVFEEGEEDEVPVVRAASTTARKSSRAPLATATTRKTGRKRSSSSDDEEEPLALPRARKITFADEDDDAEDEISKRLTKASLAAPERKSSREQQPIDTLDAILQKEFPTNQRERTAARISLCSGLRLALVTEALISLCPEKFGEDAVLAKDFASRYAIDEDLEDDVQTIDDEGRSPVLLCLSGSLQQIPWENLPCLLGMRVSRIPSLPFALEQFPRSKQTKEENAFIVDPGNNLRRTQEELRPKLEELVNGEGVAWEGIVGNSMGIDMSELFKRYLSEKSLVLYCGHGGGEEYLRREEIVKLDSCAVTLLMGCSSGARKDLGVFEPNGVVDAYALARSPLVVGNLWNVTDRDIDRFTLALLEGLQQGKRDLLSLVAKSRKVCKLQRLVGAAPVCFGVPWMI